jgi:hypothetical protein
VRRRRSKGDGEAQRAAEVIAIRGELAEAAQADVDAPRGQHVDPDLEVEPGPVDVAGDREGRPGRRAREARLRGRRRILEETDQTDAGVMLTLALHARPTL